MIFRQEYWKMKKGYCAAATLDEVAKQDYILTPGRYVGIAEAEDDGEPFLEKWSDSLRIV